jgi:hypothetical protein
MSSEKRKTPTVEAGVCLADNIVQASPHDQSRIQAAAETWALTGTEAIVFRICEAIW